MRTYKNKIMAPVEFQIKTNPLDSRVGFTVNVTSVLIDTDGEQTYPSNPTETVDVNKMIDDGVLTVETLQTVIDFFATLYDSLG